MTAIEPKEATTILLEMPTKELAENLIALLGKDRAIALMLWLQLILVK